MYLWVHCMAYLLSKVIYTSIHCVFLFLAYKLRFGGGEGRGVGCAPQLLGSWFPDEGSSLNALAVEEWSPNHWDAREFPKFTCWSLTLNVMILGNGTYERWLGYEGGALMSEISALISKTPKSSPISSAVWGHSKKMASFKSESGSSPGT